MISDEPPAVAAPRSVPVSVRPTPLDSHWRESLRLPGFWLVLGLLVMGVWRICVIMWPAMVSHPRASTVAVILFAAYAVPFILVVGSLDYLEREPPPLLLVAGAWGGLVALSIAVPANVALQEILAKVASPGLAVTWGPALTGPLVEEPLKMLGVVAVVLIARRHINSVVDGFVYGSFVGLGFQVVENVMYAVNAVNLAGDGDRVEPVIVTFLLRGFLGGLWSHTLFSALAGAGVAFLVLRHDRPLWTQRIPVAAGGLLAAWAFHFLWNSPWLADGFGYGALGVIVALLIKGIPALLVFLLLVRSAGRREADYYTRELAMLADNKLATAGELDALRAGYTRAAARRYARQRHGRACANAVRRLQRQQARLAVELSRGGDKVERYKIELLVERQKLTDWGHPEAYAPSGAGTPWFVWVGGGVAAAVSAILLAVVIRALGGA